MALINDQDASSLNIHNLDSRYKQYSATLNELRDPNNLSYTNSNVTNGVESVNTNATMNNVQQGVDLKEQLLNIITSNNQSDNLKQVSFNNVQSTSYIDDIDELPLDDIKVFCEEMPSLNSLTTNIDGEPNPHSLEPNFDFLEEGHFHREIPQAKNCNLKRVRNRLLLDQRDSNFFDITGEIKNDAPTLRHVPPFFLNDQSSRAPFESDHDTISYVPASIWTIENSNVARHVRVEISQIRFTSHELSSDQDLLTNQLITLYEICTNDIQFPKTEYFIQKIQAFREDLKHHPERERKLLEEIVECHKMRDIEERRIGEKRDSLLECWHMLKEAREKSKPTTTICLRWKAKKFNDKEKHEEEILFDKDIKHRAQEIQRLRFLLTDENIDINELIRELKENHEQMGLRMPGETKWIPILAESPRAEFSELSAQEQNRFKCLAKTKISVGFYMGIYEVISDDVQLTSDFIAYPDVGCHAIALHVPPSVKIHIFETRSSKRREIATAILPVFNGEPPVFDEYEFTSTQPLQNGRMIQGYIEGRCFVETDSQSLETIIKDTRDEFIRKESLVDRMKKRPILMSNKLMAELVNKHDPNDPYLTAAIATMKAHRLNEADDKKFALDRQLDSTLFASMAASDVWKQIPNRAFDLLRPTAQNPDLYDSDSNRLRLYDVITQPPPSTLTDLFKSIFGFFKRGKKNRSISSKEANITHRIDERSAILLHIHQILKVPLRSAEFETFSYTVATSSPKDNHSRSLREKGRVRTKEPNVVVRLSLQGADHTHAVITGKAAEFDQQVQLLLVKEGETIPDYQQIEEKTIRIDIFDEYCKEELQFIGTLQIPLRSIFINGKVTGTFSITSPHFTMEHILPSTLSQLSLSISLRPRLVFDRQHLPSPAAECDEVNDRAHVLWNSLHRDHPERNYSMLVMTTEGRSYLPCRMCAQQSITEIRGFDELHAFISMIPTNTTADKTDKSAWSTSDEVIDNNSGTNIEHALLYCNLLLGQNIKAYIVLGTDKISGYEAYVLVVTETEKYFQQDDYLKNNEDDKERKKMKAERAKAVVNKEKLTLYNPTNGRVYKIDSDDLPLIDVTTVFNNINVYFNIQESGKKVSELNWNFYNEKCWQPFFSTRFNYIYLKSIQPTDLVIPKANEERVSYIKKKVKRIITETVESLRPTTKWFKQNSLKQSLKELLIARKDIEKANAEKSKSFNDLMQDTIQKFNSFRIVGSPFFISYVYDDDANDGILRNEIYDEIKKREICSCYLSPDGKKETLDTFYSFAVELKPFPNEIYAIWVLLVAIHPKSATQSNSRMESEVNEKKKANDSQSEYYYDEEEEEEEDRNEIKHAKGRTQQSKAPQVHASDSIEIEEEESDNESSVASSRNSKNKSHHNSSANSPRSSKHTEKTILHVSHHISSSISPKSQKQSQNETENISHHGSTITSPRSQKHAQNEEGNRSHHSSALNSARSSKRSQIESEKQLSQQNSARSEKHISYHNSPVNSPRSQKQAQNEEGNRSHHSSAITSPRNSERSQIEGEKTISQQNSARSQKNPSSVTSPRSSKRSQSEKPRSTHNSSANSQKSARKSDDDQSNKDPVRRKESPLRKIGKQRHKKVANEEESSLVNELSNISSASESSGAENRPVSLGKILMLGEALEGSNSPKRSGRKSNKPESKISGRDSEGGKDNLIKKKVKSISDSDSNDGNKRRVEKKKSQSKIKTDDDGEEAMICVISDVSLSVPSPAVVKYSKRIMKDSRLRKRVSIQSDSDNNNDSVYQMKKQANQKNNFGSDAQADLKKKQSPTRRKNRDDNANNRSSPIKSHKKKSQTNISVNSQDKEQNGASAVLLSSDSEN